MLQRMYTRWAERHGMKVELVDQHSGEQAGIKSATMLIKGENAYGYAKTESGVHRLVRISPYDSAARAAHQLRQRLGLSGDRREYRQSRSTRASCASTPIAHRARAGNTSTRPIRRCASRTS